MNKRVYFAGSIRGGRRDADLYKRIIDYINKTDIVLTEHIGDPSKSSLETKPNAQKEIYARDIEWLESSDLVIAECSNPSLGVGYELAYAEKKNIPVYIFFNKDRGLLSAMLTGDDYFKVYLYSNEEEIYPILDKILK